MTPIQRKKFMRDMVTLWSRYFRVTQDIGVKFDHYLSEGEGDHFPQFLRAEEQVISQLERAIVGEKDWARMNKAIGEYAPGAQGICDVNQLHYNRATIVFFDPLMKIDSDELFVLFGKSAALHEVLHIVQAPLAQYCETLETKG